MSEMDIAKLLNTAFGPVFGTIFTVAILVIGGKVIKPQLAGAGAQAELIEDLRKESDKWQKLYDETHAQNKLLERQNAELHSQTGILKAQAQMMYRMLEKHSSPEDLKIFAWLMIDDQRGGQ